MKRRYWFFTAAAACIAAIAAITSAASTASAQNLQKLRMTIPVPALVFYPIFVAQDKGFFANEGIEMEVINTQGDGPDVDALIAGSVQFTVSTPTRLLTAYEQGRKLTAVMSVVNRMAIQCFMNKETAESVGINPQTPLLEKFKKLDGLVIGGTRPGSFTYLLGIDYLKRAGLKPQEDARVIGVGGASAMIAAVENKQVHVGCFGSPIIELAVSRGKSVWFVNNTQGEDSNFDEFLFELLYVRPDYAEENPKTVRSVTRALVNANKWIMQATDADHLSVAKPRFEKVADDILLESVANVKASIRTDGCITPKSVAAAVDFLKRVDMVKADIPWDAVADNSFLPEKCNVQ
jgi:NitT/TauT family transport system substrate-binding protein